MTTSITSVVKPGRYSVWSLKPGDYFLHPKTEEICQMIECHFSKTPVFISITTNKIGRFLQRWTNPQGLDHVSNESYGASFVVLVGVVYTSEDTSFLKNEVDALTKQLKRAEDCLDLVEINQKSISEIINGYQK